MTRAALSTLLTAASASYVAAQTLTFPATPLISQLFPTPSDAPYQIYGPEVTYVRGPQSGYNQCNSTTEGDASMCQTSFVNGLDDFCLWAPPNPNSLIADTEGEEVAWCTKKGHGTRIMSAGTIKGAQLLKTPNYWMITGLIDQPQLNIQAGDFGGELDSGGQDERGNPIGGLMYSSAFESSPHQITWWTSFIGSNQFCIKICNPTGQNNPGYCQHTLDRIGLSYNCPSKYTIGGGFAEGEFEVCDSEHMTVPGIYVENGVTLSYSQPPESDGPITTVPYDPSLVASSNCATTASAALYTDLPAASNTPSVSATGSAATSAATGKSGSASATASKSGSSTSRSGSAAAASSTSGSANGAASFGASALAAAVGVAFSVAMLA
ncbi:hypothetical protein OF83DRAFT_128814 [Amylostereum chailletii]|nr:hypothetical protein OF83DRAFT_128814 [Amylostereum chailletii]